MDGVHDLGGRQGYGPIDVNEPEEAFHEAWEGRVLGMVRSMSRPEDWSIDWFRHCRELIDAVDYLSRPYYDSWLQTYGAMLVNSGVATVQELADGKDRGAASTLPPALAEAQVPDAAAAPVLFNRPLSDPPAFQPGDKVRAKRHRHSGHTRLPQYVCGVAGAIHACHGGHVFPDAMSAGEDRGETLYTVAFQIGDLWGDVERPDDIVYLDLWESYLEPL
ncbi:MAG: nitrile hydratase subunit beta [Pseudomonadota bacterium]